MPMNAIDITGNWESDVLPADRLQTREPEVKQGQTTVFRQRLQAPAGIHALELVYWPDQDSRLGKAIEEKFDGFDGLSINGSSVRVAFLKMEGTREGYRALVQLEEEAQGSERELQLALTLCASRPLHTRLIGDVGRNEGGGAYQALPPISDGQLAIVRGIPFHLSELNEFEIDDLVKDSPGDRGGLHPWNDGMTLPCYGAKVRTAHFLGMIHSIDVANGSWFSPKGDHGYSHFVGDKAGEIAIRWTDGEETVVPLVFGFNMWYSRAWDMFWHWWMYGQYIGHLDEQMFSGRDDGREIVEEAVALVDGIRAMGSLSSNARFVFSVDLGEREVESISLKGDPLLYGHPVVSAVTLETAEQCSALPTLPDLGSVKSARKPVSLEQIETGDWQDRVERLQKLLYTYVDELPVLDEPLVPDGYFGPRYRFEGNPDSVYAATFLYRNGPECAAYIADNGTDCSSSTARQAIPHYIYGMGIWFGFDPVFGSLDNWFKLYRERSPGELSGISEAWARGVGELLREAMAFGYDKFVRSYVDWLDNALFAEANPPHWNRIVGRSCYTTYEVEVGGTVEKGVRENDGHGICMWGRYMVWHGMGRPADWNEQHFAATEAAVEWIEWQLANDRIRPGVRKDVLFTESECAHGSYDIYSSYNCLHGIKLSIRMAEQLGRTELAERWKQLYERLRQGILDHLVDPSEDGPIWHTEEDCYWQDHAHKLVPIQLATEGDSYTPLEDWASGDSMDRTFLEISENSYRHLMRSENYNCLRMFGYGQGMMTQSALLLDRMADAEKFLHLMLTHTYLPHLEGWAAPEGIIVHRSGRYYLPVNGYMGQDSHVADSTKAVRLLLGIDDNDPCHLRLVPRYPADWTKMSISEYPVVTGQTRQSISYVYDRGERESASEHTFSFELQHPVDRLSIRLGPYSPDTRIERAYWNGSEIPFACIDSGDSRWVWVSHLSGKSGIIRIVGVQPIEEG